MRNSLDLKTLLNEIGDHTHNADSIEPTSSRQFVTTEEKEKWNNILADGKVSGHSTWSSSKISSELSNITPIAKNISIADSTNKFEATNVEDALLENKTSILELQTEVNGQRLRGINIINNIYDKIEG